ncbi:MAG: hypothetical protein WAO71_09490 [Gallionella sp.]
MKYFSDQENGVPDCTEERIPEQVWNAIKAKIQKEVERGAFGNFCPKKCEDGGAVVGTDSAAFFDLMKGDVPSLALEYACLPTEMPENLTILDMVQFCYKHIAKPTQGRDYHEFFKHYHIERFDSRVGQEEFREYINTLFSRNKLVYELTESGNFERLLYPQLHDLLEKHIPDTEKKLDQMLEDSRQKFLDRDPKVRLEAIERLWDCWERLKTIDNPNDKPASISQRIKNVGKERSGFIDFLNEDAKQLTKIGNNLQIRHSEVGKESIEYPEHMDYLFHRMYATIYLLMTSQ